MTQGLRRAATAAAVALALGACSSPANEQAAAEDESPPPGSAAQDPVASEVDDAPEVDAPTPAPDAGPQHGEGGRPADRDEPQGPGGKGEVWQGEAGSLRLASGPLTGSAMARPFTCEGQGLTPPFTVVGVPEGTVALAVLLHAQTGAVHWQLTGIDPAYDHLEPGEEPEGTIRGTNSFGHNGYEPPCPPEGRRQDYVLSVFALGEAVAPPDPGQALAVYTAAALSSAHLETYYELGAEQRADDDSA